MRKIIFLEFMNCINSKKFKIIFLFIFLVNISAHLINCYKNYGFYLSSIRSAYDMSINQGITSQFIKGIILLLLPLIASMLYSDSFCIDYTSGVYKSIATRISIKKYITSKIIVTFLITFFTFFILLCLNEVLTFITFPTQGFDNNYGYPAYDIAYYNYHKDIFLDLIRVERPYLYNILFAAIISLFASLFATLSLSISLIFKTKRLLILFIVFIIYILSDIFLNIIGLGNLSIQNYIFSFRQGSISILLFWIVTLLLLIIGMFIYSQKYELEI